MTSNDISNADILSYLKEHMITKTEFSDRLEKIESRVQGLNNRVDRLSEEIADVKYAVTEDHMQRLQRLEDKVFH